VAHADDRRLIRRVAPPANGPCPRAYQSVAYASRSAPVQKSPPPPSMAAVAAPPIGRTNPASMRTNPPAQSISQVSTMHLRLRLPEDHPSTRPQGAGAAPETRNMRRSKRSRASAPPSHDPYIFENRPLPAAGRSTIRVLRGGWTAALCTHPSGGERQASRGVVVAGIAVLSRMRRRRDVGLDYGRVPNPVVRAFSTSTRRASRSGMSATDWRATSGRP
jgi:hypothetical protein